MTTGPPVPSPGTRWTLGVYAWALLLTAGLAYFVWRMPYQMSDNAGNQITLFTQSMSEILNGYFHAGPYFRPFLWGWFKLGFELSGTRHLMTFQIIEILQLGLLLVLFARLLKVRSNRDFLVAAMAFVVLIGLPSFSGFIVELYPINGYLTIALIVLAAINLSESRGGIVVDLSVALLLGVAALMVESGILVWVALVSAYLAGARGVSRRGIVLATAVLAAYFCVRIVLIGGGAPGLDERSSGFGFGVLDPPELISRFGPRPWVFYAYNVVSSLSSLLFAEPRAGVWILTRALVADGYELTPVMALTVMTSVVTSVLILGYTLTRARRWLRLDVKPEERLVVVFWGLALANAVMSFGYTKDQIISVAGCAYALAAFAVVRHWMLGGVPVSRIARMVVLSAVFFASCGWSIRAAGMPYKLTQAAFRNRQDWVYMEDWLKSPGQPRHSPEVREFLEHLRREALETPVPHPFLVYGRKDSGG